MQDRDFLDGMDRLRATFGAQFYQAEKEKLIAGKVKYLPAKAWTDCVDNLILSRRYAPTPVEIIEETKIWLRAHPEHIRDENPTRPCDCLDCYETGWIYFESEHGSSLMCCHCRYGAETHEQSAHVARWEKGKFDRVFGFKMRPFPLEKFIPPDGDINRLFKRGHDVVDWWKEERARAVQFWKDLHEKMRAT